MVSAGMGIRWSRAGARRQFLDTKSVVAAAEKAGYTDIYKTELISLTAFEKLMGKKSSRRFWESMWSSHPVSWHLSRIRTPEKQSICRLRKMNLLSSTEGSSNTQKQIDGGFLLWLTRFPVQLRS